MTHSSSNAATAPVISGGIELAVASRGRGPRLIALHGGPGLDHHLLLPLADRLATWWEVWLPDLPGHGASPRFSRPPGLVQLQEQLGRWLARQSEPPIAYLGHSLGAFLVRELLRQRKIPPRPAILLSPPGGGSSRSTPVRRLTDQVPASGSDARRLLLTHLQSEVEGPLTPQIVALVDRSRLRPPGEFRSLLRNLHRRLSNPPRPFRPEAPLLILSGSDDRTTPSEQAARVAAATDGSRYQLLDGCGHYLIVERPDEVADAIRCFLAAAGAASGDGTARA